MTRYIARDSAAYARAVATRLLTTAKSIPRFPEIGRIVPEFGDAQIRERFVYSYRLIYRIELRRVLIMAILHGKRLIGDMSSDG